MAIDLSLLATVLVSFGALISAVAAYSHSKAARRQSDLTAISTANKVTIEAFDTAKSLWETSVKDARAYIGQLRLELSEAKRHLAEAKTQLEEAGNVLAQEKTQRQFLQIQVDQLKLVVRRLEIRLEALGISADSDDE